MNSQTNPCIVQWNCNGFHAHKAEVDLLVNKLNPFMICIQESRCKPTHIPKYNGYNCFYKNHLNFNNASGGVLICIKKNIQSKEVDLNTNLQAVAVEMQYPKKFVVCNLYIPPNQHLNSIELDQLILQLPKPFLLLGDMNAHSPLWGSYKQNDKGIVFENMLSNSNDIVCLNNGSSTHINLSNGTKSAIDLTFATPNLFLKTIWRTLSDLHHSDHYPIIISFPNQELYQTRRSKWVIEKADWPKFTNILQIPKSNNCLNIDIEVKNLTEIIIEAASQTIPKTTDRIQRKKVPWWNDAIKDAIIIKRQMLRIFNRNPTVDNLVNYKRANAFARRLVLEAKEQSWKLFVSSITDETPSTLVFNKIAKISGVYKNNSIANLNVNNISITDPKLISNELGTAFAFSSSSSNYTDQFNSYRIEEEKISIDFNFSHMVPYNRSFSLCELNDSLKNCKGSSPGIDEIHYEMIKHLSCDMKTHLLKLYNKVWNEDKLPDVWRTALIVPILKTGKPAIDPFSYRPIALTSCLLKVMEGMVNNRLKWLLEKNGNLDKSAVWIP